MSRLAAILFLGVAACAHDHALNRGEVGAMKNDSPVTSPWYGPDADPVAGDALMAPIVDRVREMAVQVFATGGGEDVHVASGVLLGGGIVLTDLRAILVVGPDGALQPAAAIAVVSAQGVFAARIVGAAADAGVAALELPDPPDGPDDPPLADGPGGSDDPVLAVRASREGPALQFEAIGFSVDRTKDPLRLQPVPGLPRSFAGAPVVDASGALAGLLVGPTKDEIILVPSGRLLQILESVRPEEPEIDNHI